MVRELPVYEVLQVMRLLTEVVLRVLKAVCAQVIDADLCAEVITNLVMEEQYQVHQTPESVIPFAGFLQPLYVLPAPPTHRTTKTFLRSERLKIRDLHFKKSSISLRCRPP